jgi:hypothetical protein
MAKGPGVLDKTFETKQTELVGERSLLFLFT